MPLHSPVHPNRMITFAIAGGVLLVAIVAILASSPKPLPPSNAPATPAPIPDFGSDVEEAPEEEELDALYGPPTTHTDWDLAFSYPENWFVTTMPSSAGPGRSDLRITSEAGMSDEEFTHGVQIDLRAITPQHPIGNRETVYLTEPDAAVTVARLEGGCVPSECHATEYLIVSDGSRYLATVVIRGDAYDDDLAMAEMILLSLSKE